jgi:acyl-homoserine lactone acylase PvdQ
VNLNTTTGAALSVQYTGFSGTRELDTFLLWDTARNLDDFLNGLQYFDSGTQNSVYADVRGNIAYFTSSEMPLREDLQAGIVAGAPPWFIRNGQGGNEWLPLPDPPPGQAIPLRGKLHRITFAHPLGSPFSIPPAGGAFPPPLAGLPGIPTDGGFGAVDASNHDPRAQSYNEFMFTNGPVNRFAAEAGPPGVRAESVWPGGTSGVLWSPFYFNLLPRWLTNDTIPLLYRTSDLQKELGPVSKFVPK